MCMFSAIQKLQHHIQTEFGDSTKYTENQIRNLSPKVLIVQGSDLETKTWMAVSTLIL